MGRGAADGGSRRQRALRAMVACAMVCAGPRSSVGTTVTYTGAVSALSARCAVSSGTTAFTLTQTSGPATTAACRLIAYDYVYALEQAEANVTNTKTVYDADANNAEYHVANLVGIDDAAVTAAKAKNATSYAAYAAALVTRTTASTALDGAVIAAATSAATLVSTSGNDQVFSCTALQGSGGRYAVVATAPETAGGVIESTKPVSTQTIRRTKLTSYGPKAGPSTGGTVVTFVGEGFNDVSGSKMSCKILDGNVLMTQTAVHLPDGKVTCETFAQSQPVDINLVYPDSCSETAPFVYYQNPEPTTLTPKEVPRFGASNFTLYASNVDYALLYGPGGSHPTYAGMLTMTCAIGMGKSAIQTGAATAVFPAVVASNGQSVICMIPDDVIPAGVHDVRVSFNGQQYLLPEVLSTAPEKVSITAYGPVARVKHHTAAAQHAREGARLVKVPVELLGNNRRVASVDIDVKYGGLSPVPGSTGDAALVQVNHTEARDNSSSVTGDYDFSVHPLTLHWAAGDTADAYVYIHLNSDDVHEADLEALTLTLVNAKNCDIAEGVENRTAIVTIEDEDAAPMFAVRPRTAFYPPLYRVREKIQVPIDQIAGGRFALPAVIEYTTTVGTSKHAATSNVYVNVTKRLTWLPEQYDTTQYAEVELDWRQIPPEADFRLDIKLTAISEARVAPLPSTFNETTDAAVFIYGVPQGSCPPGTVRADPASWVAPPPLAPAPAPPPPAPPPPDSLLDSAILKLSVVANSTAATGTVFPTVLPGITLTPAFDPAVYAYSGTVEPYVVGVQVYYQFRQSTTTATSAQARRRRRQLLAASDVYMTYYVLKTGVNTIQLTTTAPNGQNIERYTLTITRHPASPNPPPAPPPPPSPPPSPPPWTGQPPSPPPAVDAPPPPAPPPPPPPTARLTAPQDTASCKYCPAGTFSSIMNALNCTECPVGYVAPASRSKTCTPCPPGEYMHLKGGLACLTCPMDSYSNTSGVRLCSPCASGVTTATSGSKSCDVVSEPVPKDHPDVYYVDVSFGISFHQPGGSLAGFAPNVGLNANDDDAFVRATVIDVAKQFNVTRGATVVEVVPVDSSAKTPFKRRRSRRRALLQDAGVTVTCYRAEACVAAAVVSVTMQATTIPRYGVTRDHEKDVKALEDTKLRAQSIVASLQNDPSGFFATVVAGIGGTVTGHTYVSADGGVSIEKVPEPPPSTPNVYGGVDVAVIVVAIILSIVACTFAYIMRRRWRTQRELALIEAELAYATQNTKSRHPNHHKHKRTPPSTPPPKATKNKPSWAKYAAEVRDIEQGIASQSKKSQVQMRESSQASLAQAAKFRERRGQSAVQSMWAQRNQPPASIGVRAPVRAPGGHTKR